MFRNNRYGVQNFHLFLFVFFETGAKMTTVKFLNFRTPENIAVIYLKFNLKEFHLKGANGIAK